MIEIPLQGGEIHQISDTEIRMKQDGYPSLDVAQEYWKMQQWCEANPRKRKTKRGISRFINDWLNRACDRQKQQSQEYSYAASHKRFQPEKPKQITRNVGMAALAALTGKTCQYER